MKHTRLSKLFLSNAVVGLFALIAVSVILYFLIRTAFINRTVEQLDAVNALKANQINDYIHASSHPVADEDFNDIQEILLENTGMGSTGESYIVGPDKKLRSKSRFFPERSPMSLEIREENVGKDHIRIDYRGKEVLSVSRELKNPLLNWHIVTEIDLEEAIEPAITFRNYLVVIAVIGGAFFVNMLVKREIGEVRNWAALLLEGQENERKRLTRELHDGVGQLLTAIRLRIDATTIDSHERKEIITLINETIAEVKQISYNMMPGSLVDFGLEAALKGLCDNTEKYSGLKFDFRYVRDSEHTLNFDVTVAVFRIAQEGINNILKHAQATKVELNVIENDNEIYLLLKDNGKGFDKTLVNNTGYGLRSMMERAKLSGGSLEVHADPGNGTVVSAHIPVQR